MQLKKKLSISVIAVIALVAVILGIQMNKGEHRVTPTTKIASERIVSSPVPTVFIHGYLGGLKTFETMLKNYYLRDKDNSNIVTIAVQPDGKLVYQANTVKMVKHPLIKVYFENNKASVDQQLKWTEAVMRKVAVLYKTTNVNIVAHSMGGITATKYIIDTSNDKRYPKVDQFVTLSSPIKGWKKTTVTNPAERDLLPGSAVLTEIYNNRDQFPSTVDVFSAYGTRDALVTADSAKGLKDFTNNIITSGFDDDHSSIHEDPEVINSVYSFLMN
ncbi:alpha/beta hydrolase [Neobacillus vireti]|uniref:alpha/beta hydrolase n=1 Tax=Neobacillus vireti TaxID=220686 RepID=UPI002FFE4BD1